MLMALILVVFFNFSAMILVLSCFLIGILSALYDLKVKGKTRMNLLFKLFLAFIQVGCLV